MQPKYTEGDFYAVYTTIESLASHGVSALNLKPNQRIQYETDSTDQIQNDKNWPDEKRYYVLSNKWV